MYIIIIPLLYKHNYHIDVYTVVSYQLLQVECIKFYMCIILPLWASKSFQAYSRLLYGMGVADYEVGQ